MALYYLVYHLFYALGGGQINDTGTIENSSTLCDVDNVITTMKKTGMDIHAAYRETSEGGLATLDI